MKQILESINSKRGIGWELWVDPFGENIHKVEWPGAHGTFETDEIIDDDDDDDEEWNEDEYKNLDGNKKTKTLHKKSGPIPVLSTPFGLFPLTEYSRPSSIFDFWVGHSNFRITHQIQKTIEETDGVEVLDVFTPYRWRIGVGKVFNSRIVKENIMKNLNAQPIELET